MGKYGNVVITYRANNNYFRQVQCQWLSTVIPQLLL